MATEFCANSDSVLVANKPHVQVWIRHVCLQLVGNGQYRRPVHRRDDQPEPQQLPDYSGPTAPRVAQRSLTHEARKGESALFIFVFCFPLVLFGGTLLLFSPSSLAKEHVFV